MLEVIDVFRAFVLENEHEAHATHGARIALLAVDGVLLVVDAQEGPKPQTRFVLKKALELGHKILVIVNKVDKPASRPEYVIDKTFDLFCELGASDEQTDFNTIFASAINRKAGEDPDNLDGNMDALLKAITGRQHPPYMDENLGVPCVRTDMGSL